MGYFDLRLRPCRVSWYSFVGREGPKEGPWLNGRCMRPKKGRWQLCVEHADVLLRCG